MSAFEVLRDFDFSKDGINIIRLAAEDTIEIEADKAAGLVSEGFLRAAVAEKVVKSAVKDAVSAVSGFVGEAKFAKGGAVSISTPVFVGETSSEAILPLPRPSADEAKPASESLVEIPDDWKSSKWFALKALAKQISGTDVKDGAEARVIIEAELARRTA